MYRTIMGMTGILSLVAISITAMAILGVQDSAIVVGLVAGISGTIGTIVGYAYGVETAKEIIARVPVK